MSTPTSPGWYDDPDHPEQLRYFDGIVWTAHTTPRTSPSAASSTIGRAVPPAAPAQQPWEAPGYGQHPQQNPWSAPPMAGPGSAWQPTRAGVLPDGAVLAEWWRRLIARIVDWVIVGVVTAVLSWTFLQSLVSAFDTYVAEAVRATEQGTTPDPTAFTEALTSAALPISLISLAVTVLYETVFLVWKSATPGKLVFGTTVRRVEHAGGIRLVDALRRQVITVVANGLSIIPVVGLLGSFLSLIDPAWLLWDPKRQALHDKVADTVVVLRRP
jgi:uncharacterized RDD family membrane protein YckC